MQFLHTNNCHFTTFSVAGTIHELSFTLFKNQLLFRLQLVMVLILQLIFEGNYITTHRLINSVHEVFLASLRALNAKYTLPTQMIYYDYRLIHKQSLERESIRGFNYTVLPDIKLVCNRNLSVVIATCSLLLRIITSKLF